MIRMQNARALLRTGEELPDLSQPSLAGLSYLLRHEELWPQGFRWDYEYGDTCAMGLTLEAWDTGVTLGDDEPLEPRYLAPVLGLSIERADELFYHAHDWARRRFMIFWSRKIRGRRDVTPVMIADRIDEMLAAA